MEDRPSDEKKYTEKEVREILKKAVEKEPSHALIKSEGLSLAELKAIGKEAGIDPGRMEDAAHAVALRGSNRPNRILGAPTALSFERKVDGTFNPDDTPEIVSIIRKTTGQQGTVWEIRGSLEWSAKLESGERTITVSSRNGITTIRGSANLANAAVLTFGPASMFGVIAFMIGLIRFLKNGSPIALVFCLAVLPALTRSSGRSCASSRARKQRSCSTPSTSWPN